MAIRELERVQVQLVILVQKDFLKDLMGFNLTPGLRLVNVASEWPLGLMRFAWVYSS